MHLGTFIVERIWEVGSCASEVGLKGLSCLLAVIQVWLVFPEVDTALLLFGWKALEHIETCKPSSVLPHTLVRGEL